MIKTLTIKKWHSEAIVGQMSCEKDRHSVAIKPLMYLWENILVWSI
jgi:hypothetical protein